MVCIQHPDGGETCFPLIFFPAGWNFDPEGPVTVVISMPGAANIAVKATIQSIIVDYNVSEVEGTNVMYTEEFVKKRTLVTQLPFEIDGEKPVKVSYRDGRLIAIVHVKPFKPVVVDVNPNYPPGEPWRR